MAAPLLGKSLLEAAAKVYLYWVIEEMKAEGLKDSKMIKSVRVETDESEMSISIILPDYAKFVESGRRAGARKPPFDVILQWVILKMGPADANRKAWQIRSAIAKRGIKARPFSEEAADDALNQISHVEAPLILKVWMEDELENLFFHN